MAIEKSDVVIVGVGAAGGILAAQLGKSGMKVIGLERGPRLTTHRPRHGSGAGVAFAFGARRAGRSPRGRNAHG